MSPAEFNRMSEEDRRAHTAKEVEKLKQKKAEEKKNYILAFHSRILNMLMFEIEHQGDREYQRVPGGLMITVTRDDRHQSYEVETHRGGFQSPKNVRTALALAITSQFIPMKFHDEVPASSGIEYPP
jgi:hypothetical protein